MISDFDRTLEQLLEREFGTPLPFDMSFAMPDKDFAPMSSDKNTLNCYLYDISEDRELRSVEPSVRRNSEGIVETSPAPARIKLSYCITAWSPAQTTPGIAPELDEHILHAALDETFFRAFFTTGNRRTFDSSPITCTSLKV
jgi:hypothetical protein